MCVRVTYVFHSEFACPNGRSLAPSSTWRSRNIVVAWYTLGPYEACGDFRLGSSSDKWPGLVGPSCTAHPSAKHLRSRLFEDPSKSFEKSRTCVGVSALSIDLYLHSDIVYTTRQKLHTVPFLGSGLRYITYLQLQLFKNNLSCLPLPNGGTPQRDRIAVSRYDDSLAPGWVTWTCCGYDPSTTQGLYHFEAAFLWFCSVTPKTPP